MKVLADPVCEVDPDPVYEMDAFGCRVKAIVFHVSRGHDEAGYRDAYGLAAHGRGGLRLSTTLPCTSVGSVVQ